MLTSMEEVISVAGPELLSRERLGQALGAMQVRLQGSGLMVPALLLMLLMSAVLLRPVASSACGCVASCPRDDVPCWRQLRRRQCHLL
jgi:hypothetical protein